MKEDQDHRDETREISPLVSDCPRNMPFSIPDAYFDGLAQRILDMSRAKDETGDIGPETAGEEIERLSPLLASAFRVNPFKAGSNDAVAVPAIPANMAVEKETSTRALRKARNPAWVFAAAAAATGVIAFLSVGPSGESAGGSLAGKEKTEVANHLSGQPAASDEVELAAYFAEQLDPILLTAEATDTLMMKDAFMILDTGFTGETGIFDGIPSKDLHAFIEEVPDLSGARHDMD